MSIELINLHSYMFDPANYSAMSPVINLAIPSITVVYTLFASVAFIKYKNLVLEIMKLATNSYITMDSALTI